MNTKLVALLVLLSPTLVFSANVAAQERSRSGNEATHVIQQRSGVSQPSPSTATIQRVRPASPSVVAQPTKPVSLEAVAVASAPPQRLSPSQDLAMRKVVQRLRSGDLSGARRAWDDVLKAMGSRRDPAAVDALASHALHRAYVEPNRDLKMGADKVRFYNEQLKAAREHRDTLQRHEATLRRANNPQQTVQVRPLTLAPDYRPGVEPFRLGTPEPKTVDSVVDDLQGIVVLCNHVEGEVERGNMIVADALEGKPGTKDKIGAGWRALHDTAKAAISNVR